MASLADGERILVGRIRRAHGVRGELLVEPLSDVEGRFVADSELELVTADGASRSVRVLNRRHHRLGLLLAIEGCATREEAQALRGATLEVAGSRSPEPPAGAYYYYALRGCDCRDRTHGSLGTVTEVVEDGGGLLLEIRGSGRTLLVPFVEAFLVSVDPQAGRIEMNLPEGLVETCASTS